MARVSIQGLERHHAGAEAAALSALDLEIEDGELLVLVGPSGCGKSTALRLIAGLDTPDRGRILIGDRDVSFVPPQDRDVAMVFQGYALYPHLRVRDNIAFPLKMRGVPAAERARRVDEAAALLGLAKLLDRKPGELSGGERQRVAMGRAIVRQPQVFLFDEPLSNLDAQLRQEMRSEIKRLHQRLGATIIYVTHDQVEAMTLADRIAVLRGGHVMQYDRPHNIYHRPAADFVAAFIGSPPMNLMDVTRAPGTPAALDFGGLAWPVPAALQPALAGKRLLEKLGLNHEVIRRGERADMLSPFRGWSEDERAAFNRDWMSRAVGLLTIVIGDHQPPALVSGEGAPWDVPMHVITNRSAQYSCTIKCLIWPTCYPMCCPMCHPVCYPRNQPYLTC